jgi:hypothetical protein
VSMGGSGGVILVPLWGLESLAFIVVSSAVSLVCAVGVRLFAVAGDVASWWWAVTVTAGSGRWRRW